MKFHESWYNSNKNICINTQKHTQTDVLPCDTARCRTVSCIPLPQLKRRVLAPCRLAGLSPAASVTSWGFRDRRASWHGHCLSAAQRTWPIYTNIITNTYKIRLLLVIDYWIILWWWSIKIRPCVFKKKMKQLLFTKGPPPQPVTLHRGPLGPPWELPWTTFVLHLTRYQHTT